MDEKSKKFLDWMTDIYLEQGVDIQNIKPSISHRRNKLDHFTFLMSRSLEFGKVEISPVFASNNQKVGWYVYEFEYQSYEDKNNRIAKIYKKYFNYNHDGIMTEWKEI